MSGSSTPVPSPGSPSDDRIHGFSGNAVPLESSKNDDTLNEFSVTVERVANVSRHVNLNALEDSAPKALVFYRALAGGRLFIEVKIPDEEAKRVQAVYNKIFQRVLDSRLGSSIENVNFSRNEVILKDGRTLHWNELAEEKTAGGDSLVDDALLKEMQEAGKIVTHHTKSRAAEKLDKDSRKGYVGDANVFGERQIPKEETRLIHFRNKNAVMEKLGSKRTGKDVFFEELSRVANEEQAGNTSLPRRKDYVRDVIKNLELYSEILGETHSNLKKRASEKQKEIQELNKREDLAEDIKRRQVSQLDKEIQELNKDIDKLEESKNSTKDVDHFALRIYYMLRNIEGDTGSEKAAKAEEILKKVFETPEIDPSYSWSKKAKKLVLGSKPEEKPLTEYEKKYIQDICSLFVTDPKEFRQWSAANKRYTMPKECIEYMMADNVAKKDFSDIRELTRGLSESTKQLVLDEVEKKLPSPPVTPRDVDEISDTSSEAEEESPAPSRPLTPSSSPGATPAGSRRGSIASESSESSETTEALSEGSLTSAPNSSNTSRRSSIASDASEQEEEIITPEAQRLREVARRLEEEKRAQGEFSDEDDGSGTGLNRSRRS